ncbi:MAG: hypothetical protein CVT66_04370 [Actinobacteria bacterium HGW-Actinobacteria-6]|nr:MAG: hypothetical protein CVT66_04370 [Actinobacteria bacterium HGW-Actinobacteria-6]
MNNRWIASVATFTLVIALGFPSSAAAFMAEFFDADASGNAVYEDMVIRPEAVYDAATGKTLVAYQGWGMNPFIAAYDDVSKTWEGPYQLGVNPLDDDAHGGPSIIIDGGGYIHAFYGSHGASLLHARSISPHDISAWENLGAVLVETQSVDSTVTTVERAPATYPQPVLQADGTIRLFYRGFASGDTYGQWYSAVATDGLGVWTQRESVLMGKRNVEGWYVNFCPTSDGDVLTTFLFRDLAASGSDYFIRRNVYFMRRDGETGLWQNALGEPVPDDRSKASLDATCLVYDSGTQYVNQVVVRDSEDGPCILFVSGSETPRPSYDWKFIRWSSEDGTWTAPTTIVHTDHLFDAGTFQVLPDGEIEAFLTVGGTPDENSSLAEAFLAARGGDIVRFTSKDGGASFRQQQTLKASPGAWARYNDPQIVDSYEGGPRVFFSEWNNDFANYVHKVFLWGDDGFAGREFTPESERLAGINRVGTAVEVSKETFSSGASTVVIASKANFPDALCGAPLAHSLKAPIILTDPRSLEASAAEEITRLGATKAVLLGSESALSAAVASQVSAILGKPRTVKRLGGTNRYETAVLIQREMAAVRGVPARVVVASGVDFPDALAISPLAAKKNMPILLTHPTVLTPVTADAIAASGATSAIIVGSDAAVSVSVAISVSALTPWVSRLGGDDRWQTARIIGEYAQTQGMSLERFVVCTGENFPDALAGGVLAARVNGLLLLTEADALPSATSSLLNPMPDTIRWYILGADSAVSANVANDIASRLFER